MPAVHRRTTDPGRRRLLHLGLAQGLAGTLLVQGGCSSTRSGMGGGTSADGASHTPLPTPTWRAAPGQALLLGEVHDNATQHALRARGLAALLALGDRPALVLEQFDRTQQPAIDALYTPGAVPPADQQASHAGTQVDARTGTQVDARVDALVRLGGAGWHWPFYRPCLQLAVAHGLPVLAANVSRAEARLVMQQGLAATGWRADVPADILRAQTAAIAASHCGQLDAAAAARLALAQVARDQAMARLVAQHAARGVVLLAGNGHVRADIGVPRWLDPALRARTLAVGLLEAGDPSAAAFDSRHLTAAQPRPDPCAGLQMPAAIRGG